jgi:hypothetical protein
MGEDRKVYKVLLGNPERKRPLRRLRHRWGMGSEWTLGCLAGDVEWIQMAQDRDCCQDLLNAMMDL